jgi:hypothetical protein
MCCFRVQSLQNTRWRMFSPWRFYYDIMPGVNHCDSASTLFDFSEDFNNKSILRDSKQWELRLSEHPYPSIIRIVRSSILMHVHCNFIYASLRYKIFLAWCTGFYIRKYSSFIRYCYVHSRGTNLFKKSPHFDFNKSNKHKKRGKHWIGLHN